MFGTFSKEEAEKSKPSASICPACEVSLVEPMLAGNRWFARSFCEACKQSQAEVAEKERQEREAEYRVRAAEQLIIRLKDESGLTGRHWDMTFETFLPEKAQTAFEKVKKYAESFDDDDVGFVEKGLYLFGKTGSGKTHLSAAVANHLIKQRWGVKMVRTVDILSKIRNSFRLKNDDDGQNESEIMEEMKEAGLLILDDFGVEKPTDWMRQVFYEIIDTRWINEGPVIITSNLSLGELENQLGDERITSRIAEMCEIIQINQGDFRVHPFKK